VLPWESELKVPRQELYDSFKAVVYFDPPTSTDPRRDDDQGRRP
jgi:hypothetical protein